jgi:3-deoxy-D-manno-octulosonic acid kinase
MLERQVIDRGAILFDPQLVRTPGPELFEPEYLRARGRLSEEAGGRGTVRYFDGDGVHWVLRRYLRGGMAARLARDRFLWLGEDRTRSFRAARYRRGFASYRAELMTGLLPGVESLTAMVAAGRMDDARWAAVGRCLRRFHDAGVQHADLNSDNIMLDGDGGIWVLDFDRGRLRKPGAWRERVLDRLARSIAKRRPGATDWQRGFSLLRRAHDA